MTLNTLSAALHKQYENTNRRILSGENEHVRFFKDGRFHVTTPKLEEDDSESVSSLFPRGRYISLLEVLSSVNRLSHFLDAFEDWQTKYTRARPPNKTFFAGIIGIGCFIGTRKMEKISNSMSDPGRRTAMLQSVAAGSVVSWRHINLLGEYDFSEEKLRDSFGIKPPQILDFPAA